MIWPLLLLVFAGAKMVGNCDVYRRTQSDISHIRLFGIVILEGYRRIGIGQMMTTTGLHEALRRGVWLVELTVFATNEVAIRLYEKL